MCLAKEGEGTVGEQWDSGELGILPALGQESLGAVSNWNPLGMRLPLGNMLEGCG